MSDPPNFKDPFPRANAGLWKLWCDVWAILSAVPDVWFDRPTIVRSLCELHGCQKKTLVNLLTSAFQYGAIDVRDGQTLRGQAQPNLEIRVSHPGYEGGYVAEE